ncbi:uncharacterized protein L199_007107 [Kwoniella botswanensis]|uniref:uncharacterized protein n=1 Tax=Kwoniella botswanensis TaxID=1268659 RepID=UPI00315CFA2A
MPHLQEWSNITASGRQMQINGHIGSPAFSRFGTHPRTYSSGTSPAVGGRQSEVDAGNTREDGSGRTSEVAGGTATFRSFSHNAADASSPTPRSSGWSRWGVGRMLGTHTEASRRLDDTERGNNTLQDSGSGVNSSHANQPTSSEVDDRPSSEMEAPSSTPEPEATKPEMDNVSETAATSSDGEDTPDSETGFDFGNVPSIDPRSHRRNQAPTSTGAEDHPSSMPHSGGRRGHYYGSTVGRGATVYVGDSGSGVDPNARNRHTYNTNAEPGANVLPASDLGGRDLLMEALRARSRQGEH